MYNFVFSVTCNLIVTATSSFPIYGFFCPAITMRSYIGARLVIGFDRGREITERNHREQYPDMVTFDLPDKITLEKAAAAQSFQITEFVDEPTFYLAVLRLPERGVPNQ